MKHLKKFNESKEEALDIDYIRQCFIDLIEDESAAGGIDTTFLFRTVWDEAAVEISTEHSHHVSAELSLTNALSTEVSSIDRASAYNFNSVFLKKNSTTEGPNGSRTSFTFTHAVKAGSEQVYINGLMAKEGDDYTVTSSGATASGIVFVSAPAATDNLVYYGVYGTLLAPSYYSNVYNWY